MFNLKSVLKKGSMKKDDSSQSDTRVKFSKNIATVKKFAKDGKKNMRPYPKKTKPPRKLTDEQVKDRILNGVSRRKTPRKRFERVENHSKQSCNIPSVLSERRGTNRLTSKKRRLNSIEQLLRGTQRPKENVDPLLKKMMNLQRSKLGKLKVNSPKNHKSLYSSPIASSPRTSSSRFNTRQRGLAILNSLQLVKTTYSSELDIEIIKNKFQRIFPQDKNLLSTKNVLETLRKGLKCNINQLLHPDIKRKIIKWIKMYNRTLTKQLIEEEKFKKKLKKIKIPKINNNTELNKQVGKENVTKFIPVDKIMTKQKKEKVHGNHNDTKQ